MKNDTDDTKLTAGSIGNEPQMSAERRGRQLAKLRAVRGETEKRLERLEAKLSGNPIKDRCPSCEGEGSVWAGDDLIPCPDCALPEPA
jgi:hypothetical protein